jgi:hypothetical protein
MRMFGGTLVVTLLCGLSACALETEGDEKDEAALKRIRSLLASDTFSREEALQALERQAATMEELQAQIDLQLRIAPGGEQTDLNEVSYRGAKFIVSYPMPGESISGWPDCPLYWFCFYDHPTWGKPRGQLSDCGWQDLNTFGWSDRVESYDHSLVGSNVTYTNHTSGGHGRDVPLWSAAAGTVSDTVPHPNKADHVEFFCDDGTGLDGQELR